MTGVMALFTRTGRKHKERRRNLRIQIINNCGMRILIANEEIHSRYCESFYLPTGRQYTDTIKRGTLLYFWKKDTMIGDITIPETEDRDVTIQVERSGLVKVS